MDMQASRQLAVTQQQAWDALNDPEVLKLCIPGCDKVEATGENQYAVGVSVKIGPVSAKFNGKITLSDIVAPQSYTITFDGQGMAHPRRCGVASHVGVRLDVPSVGIAKSVLCGEHGELDDQAGSIAPMTHRGETIGAAVRTRERVKPVYVSIGHRVDLDSAVALALACVTRYRIPEPTRLADIEVAKLKARSK